MLRSPGNVLEMKKHHRPSLEVSEEMTAFSFLASLQATNQTNAVYLGDTYDKFSWSFL